MKKTEIRLEVFNLSLDEWRIINSLCENGYSVFLTPIELKYKIGISGGSFLSGKLNKQERIFVTEYYNLIETLTPTN